MSILDAISATALYETVAPPSAAVSPEAVAVLRAIHGRRSLAGFLPEEPPREIIDALLAAANCAPNHHLTQP